MALLSRRKIAQQLAEQLLAGETTSTVMNRLAAYLIRRQQTKLAALYVRDIESYLNEHGHTIIDVTSARPLSETIKATLTSQYSNHQQAVIREHIDETVLGGIRIETANQRLDATISETLRKLRV